MTESNATATPRPLWTDGPTVSAIGLGTWAIGGPSSAGDQPLGWGARYEPDEAIAVIQAAFHAGITLFDTSDAYGTGTAERLLGQGLSGHRDEVTIVSKWGNTIDEPRRQLTGQDSSPGYVRRALTASLRRLDMEHLDAYLLHLSGLPAAQAADLLGTLQQLVGEGLIRGYGWSTDDPELAASWIGQPDFRLLEFEANVVRNAPELVTLAETNALSALVRAPLGTGLLTGAHPAGSRIVDDADFRFVSPDWLHYFQQGYRNPELTRRLALVQDVLTARGHTLAQGALAWLWANSPRLLPIPGARTVAQVRENAATLTKGPLDAGQMAEIKDLLASPEP